MKKNILQIITIGLLVVDIGLTAVSVLGGSFNESKKEKQTIEETLSQNKALDEYHRELGEESFKIKGDAIYRADSTYGSDSIKGNLKNTSNKTFDSVHIAFKLYNDGEFVGVETGYINYSEPGSELPFEITAYDIEEFDEYSLLYISAYEY